MVYWVGSGMCWKRVGGGRGGGSVCWGSGALVGVIERIRCCRWPWGWGSAVGCRSIFCQVVVWCGSRSSVVIVGGGVMVGGVASICTGLPGGVGCASVG